MDLPTKVKISWKVLKFTLHFGLCGFFCWLFHKFLTTVWKIQCTDYQSIQGPVVQSTISLTSSLRVILLTVLADSIYMYMYNILIFFAEKMWVATHIFSAKNFSIFVYHLM